jgi:hypothetical protein
MAVLVVKIVDPLVDLGLRYGALCNQQLSHFSSSIVGGGPRMNSDSRSTIPFHVDASRRQRAIYTERMRALL